MFDAVATDVVCMQLSLVCRSTEFADIQLRTNEKRTLNTLNRDKARLTIRYRYIAQLIDSTSTTCMPVASSKYGGAGSSIPSSPYLFPPLHSPPFP